MEKDKGPRRTQVERSRQRREQLIRAAVRFFSQHGYRGAKLGDIAREAGITEPGLLHHFPSKAHLLMAVLAERDRSDGERFELALKGDDRNLLGSLRRLVEYNETVPGLVQLFTVLVAESIDAEHPGHAFFTDRYRRLRKRAASAVAESQRRGEIRSDLDPEELSTMLFAMMDGLQIQWALEPERVDMARLFDRFLALVKQP